MEKYTFCITPLKKFQKQRLGTFGGRRVVTQARVAAACWGPRTFCERLWVVAGAQVRRQTSRGALQV